MPRIDIPSDEELEITRSQWENDDTYGRTIHRLCDAVTELKKRLREQGGDDRHTVPTPPPENMSIVEDTLIGVAPPPPALLAFAGTVYRCASCLDEWAIISFPVVCPSCLSQDAYPADSSMWPCGTCGKVKEGIDSCVCPDIIVEREEEEELEGTRF